MDEPYPVEDEDFHATCRTCDAEHDAIGACATCGYPVFRDCGGDVLHVDVGAVYERRHGRHLPTLAVT
ncbi:hypothetical protein [Amycolatopsis sp. NPDC004079]|uniref:hypothetical protein n=1 Tax=Amycolatopsis sp. NPDC004079 TaxID=3154549 RepID=UPI0033BD4C41